jgi:hypothetical protein
MVGEIEHMATNLQLINDLDKLARKTEPEDVKYIFSVYSRENLEAWLYSLTTSVDIPVRIQLVMAEVREMLDIKDLLE